MLGKPEVGERRMAGKAKTSLYSLGCYVKEQRKGVFLYMQEKCPTLTFHEGLLTGKKNSPNQQAMGEPLLCANLEISKKSALHSQGPQTLSRETAQISRSLCGLETTVSTKWLENPEGRIFVSV